MRMLLIAGHGAGDPGATGKYGGATYREADEARNMVSLIAAELKKQGVDAQVRDTARNANEDWKAGKLVFPSNLNYVLEIHFNAVSQSGADGKTKGVECYVTTSEKGVSVEQGICAAVASFGLTNRGVKRKNFNVISAAKKAGISAALLEICFIDDPDDMAIYIRNRAAIAKRVVQAVCEGYGLDYSEADVTPSAAGGGSSLEGGAIDGRAMIAPASAPSAWAKEACDWAVEKGIVKGDETGDCKWQEPITKEQMALMLFRALLDGRPMVAPTE